jgi:hypothetical protein
VISAVGFSLLLLENNAINETPVIINMIPKPKLFFNNDNNIPINMDNIKIIRKGKFFFVFIRLYPN